MNNNKENNQIISILLAKEEIHTFDRCSFPILDRPVITYPILASLNSNYINHNFLSTKSERLIQICKKYNSFKIIERKEEHKYVLEEIVIVLNEIKKQIKIIPKYVVILLGNSPCILSNTIDNAISIIQKNENIDSVVSAIHREDFNPNKSFSLGEEGFLRRFDKIEKNNYSYFIDSRLMVVKSENILKINNNFDQFNFLLGNNIYPLFQEDGISDIDYAWQVPIVERWLKNNGFTEKKTPYDIKEKKIIVSKDSKKDNNKKAKILITTVPFGNINSYPIDILKDEKKCEFIINPIGRKLKEDELKEMIPEYDILIAGTEPITKNVLSNAKNLKLISRVGIGLDSVDLKAARELGIKVSYTPDAPAPAVAELTIGHMLNLCRMLSYVDRKVRDGVWQRIMGSRLENLIVGIIGTGRIGSRVLRHLQGFSPKKIYVNDIIPKQSLYELYNAELVEKDVVYNNSDIITLHIPLNKQNYNLISKKELSVFKSNAVIINTSRGGIINENDLYDALKNKNIAGAAIDVFENEPYGGELITLDNCFITCHMGSCTIDCRFEMEKLATEEALRFIRGEELLQLVPEEEYNN